MRISGFTTTRPEMASTRTTEDPLLSSSGLNQARLGIVSSLYDQYTTSALTEAYECLHSGEES